MSTPPGRADLDRADLDRALRRVHDPCSLAARAPVDVVDLGLILGVDVGPPGPGGAGATVTVRMCVTSGSCTFGPVLADAVRAEVGAVAGVGTVEVLIDPGVVWDPRWLSARARADRERRHRRSAAATGLRPRQWQQPAAPGPGPVPA